MIILQGLVLLFSATFISVYAWKFMNWAWITPRKLEKCLRQQGFSGNSYQFLVGDYIEMVKMEKEAKSKPINFSNDILNRLMPFVYQSVQKYGRNCFMWSGPTPAVLITDPEMIKEMLAKNYVFQKPSHPLAKLLTQGVATYETDKWAKHRKIINPAFHLEKLKLMLPSFYETCCDMLRKWEEIVPSEGSCELDVYPYLQTLTSDAISRTAFGSNYEEGRKIFELQTEQSGLLLQALMMSYIPGWRFLPTKSNRRMKQVPKEIESSIIGLINKRMKLIEAGEEKSDDLLGILLESNYKEIQQNGDGSGMIFQDVVEECKLFYIAGQETTASLIVWTMILLSTHSEWQDRAREEVMKVFGSDKPDYELLNHLKIVTMILQEVHRLYPSGGILARTIHQETTIGNVTLPAGVEFFLATIMLHHDPVYWGDDAKEFKPERFSEGIAKATKGQFTYLPFGGGHRICVGQNFAMLEAKMAIAMILQKYSFELSPSYAHGPDMVLSLKPQFGAQLIDITNILLPRSARATLIPWPRQMFHGYGTFKEHRGHDDPAGQPCRKDHASQPMTGGTRA